MIFLYRHLPVLPRISIGEKKQEELYYETCMYMSQKGDERELKNKDQSTCKIALDKQSYTMMGTLLITEFRHMGLKLEIVKVGYGRQSKSWSISVVNHAGM